MDMRAADQDLNLSSKFVKQGGSFKCTLSSTYDDYSFIGKAREIRIFGSVRGESAGNVVKGRGASGETSYAACDDDSRRCELLAVRERDTTPLRPRPDHRLRRSMRPAVARAIVPAIAGFSCSRRNE